METSKVWFVTGASKGLGLALVKKLLQEGYRVGATSRNKESLTREVGGTSSDFLPLNVDVNDEAAVKSAIDETISHFGGIDVVVNNAGYGQIGTLEELTDQEARTNFEANVFGLVHVIRHVMPHFRSKKGGYVLNVSSVGGFTGAFPGWGIYAATKFAVAGLTEAFAAEVAGFGVRATVVYPGYFKTNFLQSDSLRTAATPIADYKEARELEAIHQNQIAGNQPGSPEKAAEVFIRLAEMPQPPLHFFMGSDSVKMAQGKIELLQKELTENEALSRSTDF